MGRHGPRSRRLEFPPTPPESRAAPPPPPRRVLDAPGGSADALLSVLVPAHADRVEALRLLRSTITEHPGLTCVLVEHGGFPALSVVRIDGGGSRTVLCTYSGRAGEWWFTGLSRNGSVVWLAPTREPQRAARAIADDLMPRPEEGATT
ncbi:hypothetical protein GCM10010411_50250 [Actinomadura fulvescens]|uniref:Uncharacterized protein n=1 Tax=Actinomadura fulvescens TaxID=46160 RepID=A0ABP6CE31_9ACTN